MSKIGFKRGLCEKEATEKTKVFFSDGIGKKIRETKCNGNPAFQICMRDNYLNVYWHGCSVLKFAPSGKSNKYSIHSKYMGIDSGSRYLPLKLTKDGQDLTGDDLWSFNNKVIEHARKGSIPEVDVCSEEEKKKIVKYLRETQQILIDLEIAFTIKRDPNEKKNGKRDYISDRVDMAILFRAEEKVVLRMIEVKLAADQRLRARAEAPKIMKQMKLYQDFINNEKENIKNSYIQIARNYTDLELTALHNLSNVEDSSLIFNDFAEKGEIDPHPYLLIIGDKCELNAQNGHENHLDRLNRYFEAEGYPKPILWQSLT